MLKLLLAEHISPDVANRRNRAIEIRYMVEGENGYLGREDAACLREAATQGLTLVTYDRRDIGGLVWALTGLARETGKWDWTNRIHFLRR